MWVLKSSTGTLFYLHANKERTVGRRASDIILSNDDSISRRHAIVKVQPNPNLEDDKPTSVCILTDAGSKYGTFVAKGTDFVAVNGEVVLSHKDRIKFGLQEHIFRVEYIPILIVTSALSENDTVKLENSMSTIDGIVTSNWRNNCTHLTVTKITLTEKVTLALAACIPIVTTDYWLAVECAIKNGAAFPHAAQFIPPIKEEFINAEATLLNPTEKRKTLFANYTFLYFTMVQYQIYGRMVNMAGGKSVLYDKKHFTSEQVCVPYVVVVQDSNTNTTQSSEFVPGYESICKLLQANNRRLIPEYEIPLALLYCSVRKYCNPTFSFARLLKQPVKPKTHASQILVGDTQDVFNDYQNSCTVTTNANINKKLRSKPNKAVPSIPETIDASDSVNSCSAGNTKNDIKEEQKIISNVVCIPETIDAYDSVDPCNADNTENDIHEQKTVTSSVACIPETIDAYDSVDPCYADNTEKDINEQQTITSNVVCIPETIDAYDSVAPCYADNTKKDINERQIITSNVVCIPETQNLLSNTELDIGSVCKNKSKELVDLFKNENTIPEEIKSVVKDIIPESMEIDTQNVIPLEPDVNETLSTNNSNSKVDSIESCTTNIGEQKLSTIPCITNKAEHTVDTLQKLHDAYPDLTIGCNKRKEAPLLITHDNESENDIYTNNTNLKKLKLILNKKKQTYTNLSEPIGQEQPKHMLLAQKSTDNTEKNKLVKSERAFEGPELLAQLPNVSEEKKNEKYANIVSTEPSKNEDLKRVCLEKKGTHGSDDTDDSDMVYFNINRQENDKDCRSFNLDSTTSYLKINPGKKSFGKSYKLIPTTRILLTEMTSCNYNSPGKKFADVSGIET